MTRTCCHCSLLLFLISTFSCHVWSVGKFIFSLEGTYTWSWSIVQGATCTSLFGGAYASNATSFELQCLRARFFFLSRAFDKWFARCLKATQTFRKSCQVLHATAGHRIAFHVVKCDAIVQLRSVDLRQPSPH